MDKTGFLIKSFSRNIYCDDCCNHLSMQGRQRFPFRFVRVDIVLMQNVRNIFFADSLF